LQFLLALPGAARFIEVVVPWVADVIGANIWGLQGSPEGTLTQKDMRSNSQVLEDEGRWHGMLGWVRVSQCGATARM
jgi:hypothetical protein